MDRFLKWWYGVGSPANTVVKIKAIYVFNEGLEINGGYHRMISRDHADAFLDPTNDRRWENIVRGVIPSVWTHYRVEIRYERGGKKYRHIVRPGQPLTFPKRQPFGGTARVVLARLMPREDAHPPSRAVDITARALKYAGPGNSFDNVRLTDMLPFDDHEDNATRFSCVRFIDGTFRSWDVPYDPEENSFVRQ